MALNPLLGLYCPDSLLPFYSVVRPWTPPLLMFCSYHRESVRLPWESSWLHVVRHANEHKTWRHKYPHKLWMTAAWRAAVTLIFLFHWCSVVFCSAVNISTYSHGTACQNQRHSGEEGRCWKQSEALHNGKRYHLHRLTHKGTKLPWLLLPRAPLPDKMMNWWRPSISPHGPAKKNNSRLLWQTQIH